MSLKALNGFYGAKGADIPSDAAVPAVWTDPNSLSLSILLAEDETAQIVRLEKALLHLGHVVAGKTGDGQEACQFCQEIKPDLILMDQTLPKMDGLQAAFVINRNHPVPVVLMASQAKPGLVEEALEAGVHACLFKPIKQELLACSIQAAYHQFQRMRGLQSQMEDLRGEIKTRKLMGRASGILMKRLNISEHEAILRMHEKAEAKGVAPMEVAREVIVTNKITKDAS